MPELACKETRQQVLEPVQISCSCMASRLAASLAIQHTFLVSVRTSIGYSFRQIGVQAVTVLAYCDIYTATIRSCNSMSDVCHAIGSSKEFKGIHRCICKLSRWSMHGVRIIKHAPQGCHAGLLPACMQLKDVKNSVRWALSKCTMAVDRRASRVYP